MTPPSLTVAREILADAAAKARASGDPINEIAASAVDVVLAALDQRPARTVPFVSGCPAVWCRACGAWGPPGRGNAEDSGEDIANWNRRKPNTVRLGGGIEVRTRDQAVSLFGRGTALANAPLPFVMVDGTPIAEPAADPAPAPAGATGLDAQTVRILGRGMGYGRLMQVAEEQWRDVAGDGSEFTVGPCAALLVPCLCASAHRSEPCRWCEGARRVTQRVSNAIGVMRVDDATGTMTATPQAGPQLPSVGERHLAAVLRSMLEDLGLAPSGTGSEDLGILDLEIRRLRDARSGAHPREARLFESKHLAPVPAPLADVRLREIAGGVDIEIGPWAELGDAERFAAELRSMAMELLHQRAVG